MPNESGDGVTVPKPLPGLSAYELNSMGIPPTFLGLGIGLLSVLMRFGVVAYEPAYFWPMFITAWGGVACGLAMLGFRKLKERKERAAGYVTIEGFPDFIRLDRRTGAVLRMPGEPEPTRSQIEAIRRHARPGRDGGKR